MDIYQIWTLHNRAWSTRELFFFGVLLVGCGILIMRAVHFHKIKKSQAMAIVVLIIYMGIVFGSTVFTRTPTICEYALIPFWSWRAVFVKHNISLL